MGARKQKEDWPSGQSICLTYERQRFESQPSCPTDSTFASLVSPLSDTWYYGVNVTGWHGEIASLFDLLLLSQSGNVQLAGQICP